MKRSENLVLGVFPHADDAAWQCGGTLAKLVAEGWGLVAARVTKDDKDSMDLPTTEETAQQNTVEFHRAARILGASEIVDLGFPSDVMGDVSMVELRERIVRLFRKHRPYSVFSFDPYAPYEPNLDHIRVAQAVEEAFWVSPMHLHHPEHSKQGYLPYAPCEHWYFARSTLLPNYVVDITDYFEQKVAALCANVTMVRDSLHLMQMQLRTWGRKVPAIDRAMNGDVRPLVEEYLRQHDSAVAKRYRMKRGRLAEVFRVERFSSLEKIFQTKSEPLPGEPTKMFTRRCFQLGTGKWKKWSSPRPTSVRTRS